jgi:hypothetical protein
MIEHTSEEVFSRNTLDCMVPRIEREAFALMDGINPLVTSMPSRTSTLGIADRGNHVAGPDRHASLSGDHPRGGCRRSELDRADAVGYMKNL